MGAIAPWTVLDRKVAFADPRLRVRSDLCLTGTGDVVGPAHVIEVPDRVAVVAIAPGGSNILLVRRYRHGAAAVLTGLPGGVVDRAGGTPFLDAAEIAARQAHLKAARRIGLPIQPERKLVREDPSAALAAAGSAAGRELFEATGYVARQWTCLLKSYPDSSRQTNTAYGFLATGLDRSPVPPAIPVEAAVEIIEYDILTALRLVQYGRLPMDVLDTATLWSAASHIAADHSGRFDRLSLRLRRFFGDADDGSGGEPFVPVACPSAAVGG